MAVRLFEISTFLCQWSKINFLRYLQIYPSAKCEIKEMLNVIWIALTKPLSYQKQHSQPAFTCSKLTIETLEQGMAYFQS